MKRLIVVSVFLVIIAASIFGQMSSVKSDKDKQTEKEIKELCNQFADALVKKDVA